MILLKRLLPFFLCICLLLPACAKIQTNGKDSRQVSKVSVSSGIQIIAKRPFIKRGEMGILALKCEPGATCQISAVYKVSGKQYKATRTMVAEKDGSVLCAWKVDENTEVGTYEIEITCNGNRLVTTYTVQ